MGFSGFVGLRYFSGKKRLFASFMTAVAVFGVALGVFALIVVMSVMNGFSRDLQKKLLGLNASLIIEKYKPEQVAPIKEKIGSLFDFAIEVVDGEGIAESAGENPFVQGVKIRGMDIEDTGKLKDIDFILRDDVGCVVGSELAIALGVSPDYNNKLSLLSPLGNIGPTGDFVPERVECAVVGIFKSGYFEYDSKLVIVPKKLAKRLFRNTANDSLQVWLTRPMKSEKVAQFLKKEFPGIEVGSMEKSNKKLFSALKLERTAMSLLLTLIIITACISIIGIVFMFIYIRRKDIAIFSAIGASGRQIRNIFIGIGALIGLVGSLVGGSLALLACYFLKNHPFPLPSSYYLNHLPVDVSPVFVIFVVLFGVAISALAAFYPSIQATTLKPQQVLRYE